MELFDSKYFRGQGALFIGGRDESGNPSGLIFVGDIGSAELSPNMERSQTIENVTGAGGVASDFLKRSDYQITLNMRSIKPDHLVQALHGSKVVKAGTSVTDEAHTAYLDKFTPLAHTKISAVTVTAAGGTPTYVADTDYVVHADKGLIEFISGGTITDATPVLIDYTYASQHHIKIAPNNNDHYLVFAGLNSADNNKQTRCEMYKVKFDPGVLSLITEDTTEMQITGTLLLDSLRAAGDQFYSWKIED